MSSSSKRGVAAAVRDGHCGKTGRWKPNDEVLLAGVATSPYQENRNEGRSNMAGNEAGNPVAMEPMQILRMQLVGEAWWG